MGEELNNRAASCKLGVEGRGVMLRTFLEDRGPVHPHDCGVAIFIFLAVTHGERGQLLSFMNCRRALGILAVDVVWVSADLATYPVGSRSLSS